VVESVRIYLLVESPAIRPYIEEERVVAVDEFEAMGRTISPVARWLTREELLAAPENCEVAEALKAWRDGDDGSFDEESALLAQLARAEAEELGRGIQGG
jgi:hypothetical protein